MDQGHKHIWSVGEYFEVRGDIAGVRLAFALIESDMNLNDGAI